MKTPYKAQIKQVAADPGNPGVKRFEITVTDGNGVVRNVSNLVHAVENADDLRHIQALMQGAIFQQMLVDAGSAAALEALTVSVG